MSEEELASLRKPIYKKVFAGFSLIDTQGLNPNIKQLNELNKRREDLYTLNLGLFHKKKLIGWSDGIQSFDNKYYMKNSGILKEYRNKGLYSFMLNYVLNETKKRGFLEITSKHVVTNNAIITVKLKKDFIISGFEILPSFGLVVQLTHCHSKELKEMYKYRSGNSLSKLVSERLQTQ